MGPTKRKLAEDIYAQASELAADAREAFVRAAVGDDEELRRDVLSLLAAAERAGDLLQRFELRAPPSDPSEAPEAAAPIGTAGAVAGQYTLTELIGSGGMGEVWRAERRDGRYEGRVAIKLLASGDIAAHRFRREAGYLAALSHPNIARLLDAGTMADGRPYLVLEYVDGLRIDEYCDEHRLDVRARIRLFTDVLSAVAHAHAHLIVHRDIKPGNVLVSSAGVVKLLDFGVAKLLRPEPEGNDLTREGGTPLTPAFAAPEQLLDEPITTATDIYSLGALLYLLLCGRHPRGDAARGSLAALRSLARTDPPIASRVVADTSVTSPGDLARSAGQRATSGAALKRALAGDLDNILRKAMASEPAERYATAADFASDLTRYLRHEPVTAREPTLGYRARKFWRRHRGAVALGSLAITALVAVAAIAVWLGLEAARQRDAAYYQQQRLQAVNDFMSLLIEEVGPGGEPLTMTQLLDRGVAMLDRQLEGNQPFLAMTYNDVATRYATLGQSTRVLEILERAERAARRERDEDALAAVLCTRARAELRPRPEAARAAALEARQLLSADRAHLTDTTILCAQTDAAILQLDGRAEAAIDTLENALSAHDAAGFGASQRQALVLNDLSRIYYDTSRLERALELNARVLATLAALGRAETALQLAVSMNRATLLQAGGEVLAAQQVREALLDRVRAADASVQAQFWAAHAGGLIRLARYDEAVALLRTQLAQYETAGNARSVAETHMQIGRALALMGMAEQAERDLALAEEFWRRTPELSQGPLAIVVGSRALARLGVGDVAGAHSAIDPTLAAVRAAPQMPRARVSPVLRVGTQVVAASGDSSEAERLATQYLELARRDARSEDRSADVGFARLMRAEARRSRGDFAGAREDAELAVRALTNGVGASHPETQRAIEVLAALGPDEPRTQ